MLLIMILGTLGEADAGDYQVRRKAGDHTVDIRINRNPPVLGKNIILIRILNRRGDSVQGAQVRVNYYMPPMPGMPPMNYTIQAPASGDAYRAVMDLIMTGPWNIVIRVRGLTGVWSVMFPIDVR